MRLTQRGRPHRCSEGKVEKRLFALLVGLCGFLWPSEAVVAMLDVVLARRLRKRDQGCFP